MWHDVRSSAYNWAVPDDYADAAQIKEWLGKLIAAGTIGSMDLSDVDKWFANADFPLVTGDKAETASQRRIAAKQKGGKLTQAQLNKISKGGKLTPQVKVIDFETFKMIGDLLG
mmetsp:Transcript_87469/g.154312  ORF Transcript_87469/g.154312 Transcript_87469/m.154312 type:complete len:114 (-) Transcript_87469:87-428(-)